MNKCSGCSACSGGSCEPEITKTLKLNMVFDEGTDQEKCTALDGSILEALESMRSFFDENRIRIQYNSVKLINEEQADLLGFKDLPTILINGRDIQPDYKATACKCHGDEEIKGWIYKGMEHEIPPKELVVDALIEALYGKPEEAPSCGCDGTCA